MKKLFLSAFALSLILHPPKLHSQTEAIDDFLGLETEILPDLQGEQRFTKPDINQNDSWKVQPDKVIKDLPAPNKGQKYSIIPWNGLNPEEWMDITQWILDRNVKDSNPEWQIRLREADHTELMGKVLQCKGHCEVYRGLNKARVQHLSLIREGDEFRTDKDSVAWVFSIDGSLLRISPETSVSFQEISISEKEVLLLMRLNQGHVYWKPVSREAEPLDHAPETDAVSLPLLVREANQEYFERTAVKNLGKEKRFSEVVEIPFIAVKDQVAEINKLKEENLNQRKQVTRLMMVFPNGSLVSKNESFDAIHLTGGKSWFKKRSAEEDGSFEFHLRGYVATDVQNPEGNAWYEVEQNGRVYTKVDEVPADLQVLELLTKRIKTIELARQMWMKEFTAPMLAEAKNPAEMARKFGYKVWGDELDKRFQFLVEYTRRIETTNLRSVENLLVKLEENGEKPRKELSADLHRSSLNHYLLGLKSRYDKDSLRVRKMNDLQYYVWILRNGKF